MILRRLAHLLLVLFLVTLFVALLTAMMPGDPVDAIAGFASPEQKEQLRQELGLDDPVWEQYGRWVGGFVTGDLGEPLAQLACLAGEDEGGQRCELLVDLFAGVGVGPVRLLLGRCRLPGRRGPLASVTG